MSRGRFRHEVLLGSKVGNFIILRRVGKYRPDSSKYEYTYEGKCTVCGKLVTKRLSQFREYPSHPDCKPSYSTPVAFKQSPGTFSKENNR